MHLSEDVLQAYRDKELPEDKMESTRAHLEMCRSCRDFLSQSQRSQTEIENRLNMLTPSAPELPEADVLMDRVRNAVPESSTRRSRWKPAWAAVLAIGAISAAIYLEPVRVWATEFLSLFRAQHIAVIRIDPANVRQLEQGLFGRESERRIEQFLSDNAHVTKRGEKQTVQNVNEAARLTGFGIRVPSKLEAPLRIHVQPAVDASFEIDVERLQGILHDAGRSDIKIPEDLDGKTIQVNIPASATALFGKCPEPEEQDETSEEEQPSTTQFVECKMLVQLPTPVVVAPPALNIAQLGTEMLKLFGFTDEQARAFSESIDWSTTLVVPFPFDGRMNVAEVNVDGVKGQLFTSKRYKGPDVYNLLWIRDGILYSLMGRGTPDEATTIANSL